jgi:hypothetical protein
MTADFEHLVEYLITNSSKLKSRLRAHRGHQVFVFFATDQEIAGGAPPRPRDKRGFEAVVELLATTKPQLFLGRPGQAPSQLPESAIQYNHDRTVGASWMKTDGPQQPSALWRALGFDLGLGYTREVTRDDVRQELRRLIDQHDATPIDLLLVTIGTPTKNGWVYPSGGAVGTLLARDPDPLGGYAPQHIRCIAVHDVLTEPEQGGVIRGLYGELPELGLA